MGCSMLSPISGATLNFQINQYIYLYISKFILLGQYLPTSIIRTRPSINHFRRKVEVFNVAPFYDTLLMKTIAQIVEICMIYSFIYILTHLYKHICNNILFKFVNGSNNTAVHNY